MEKICSNACNRAHGMSCPVVDKYFKCEHLQCIKTTLSIFYCIQCGCNEMDERTFKENIRKFGVLLHLKNDVKENKIKKY